MAAFLEKIRKYFSQQPLPRTAFQLTSRYVSGIHVSAKDGRVTHHFILPLERGIIQPSFDKSNIKKPALLEGRIKREMGKLRISDQKAAFLLPELSLKAFVFSFDSLPSSRQERERIIRFRVKKQIPLLPDDARFSFDVIRTSAMMKIMVAVAKSSVIKEYEDFFSRFNLRVRTVGVPTLSLQSLLNTQKEKDVLLINIEEDSLCLVAAINSEIALYRLKPFLSGLQTNISPDQMAENIVKEVENTVHFIEDKEERKIQSFWLRVGLLEGEEEMISSLQKKASFPITRIESSLTEKLGLREKKILSPLIGQIQ